PGCPPRRSSRVAGASWSLLLARFPLVSQDLADPRVVPAPVHEVVVAQHAGLSVARPLEPASARLVGDHHARGDGLEAQLAEGVVRAQAHGLAGVALAPLVLFAQHGAALRAPVAPVDVLERGVTDEPPFVLEHDGPDDLVRILSHGLEPLAFRLRRERE